MNSEQNNLQSRGFSPRTAAIITGFALLLMAVLAAYANFGVMRRLVVPENAETTANNIIDSSGSFYFAIISFLVVAVLDVVVALGLYQILKSANMRLTQVAALFRIIYAVIFAFSVTKLFAAFQAFNYNQTLAQGMEYLDAFRNGWDFALILFGLHLLLLGVISFRYGIIPKWLGVLLAIAGLGYLIDSFGKSLFPGYSISVVEYTFIGELVLIFWLFWKGIKGFSQN
jgi:hypothetical protein